MKQLIQGLSLDSAYSLLRSDLSLVYQVAGDLDGGGSGGPVPDRGLCSLGEIASRKAAAWGYGFKICNSF